ncbi:MAG: hypothetical protein QM221_06175 [Bacillota bacterium]|jgi:hypothetical protein|nr:hypothetical protein [Bacillota bacterium]
MRRVKGSKYLVYHRQFPKIRYGLVVGTTYVWGDFRYTRKRAMLDLLDALGGMGV